MKRKKFILLGLSCLLVSPILSTVSLADDLTNSSSALTSASSSSLPDTTTASSSSANASSGSSSEPSSASSSSSSLTSTSSSTNTSTAPSDAGQNQNSTTEQKVPQVEYSAQVQNKGWLSPVADGTSMGTSGQSLRLQALKISLTNLTDELTGGIAYQSYLQNSGWQAERADGAVSGAPNQALRTEAIKIHLTGQLASQYSVYYRVHIQNAGWTAYAKDGAIAGSSGMAYRIEAIQIQLVKKGAAAPTASGNKFAYLYKPNLQYQAHVQNIGWQAPVKDGALAGTSGRSLRVEALKISIPNQPQGLSGNVVYQTQVQNIGWQSAVSNGAVAGTSRRALRLETLNVKLTGDLAKYFDVQYTTHVQSLGWLGWAKNGANSGTSSLGLRAEGFKIKLVPKGTAQSGSTANAYLSGKSNSGYKKINGSTFHLSPGSLIKMTPMTGAYWNLPSSQKAYPNLRNYSNISIYVNKSEQRLYVKSNNQILFIMYTSTAKASLGVTPSGNFAVQAERAPYLYEYGFNIAKTYTSWKGHGIYLFHSVTLNPNGSVNVAEAQQLGRSGMSHGCIRLSIPDAQWIYSNLRTGVPVIIR